MKARWQTHGGIVRERNGYELNTGCVIAALIYGTQRFRRNAAHRFQLRLGRRLRRRHRRHDRRRHERPPLDERHKAGTSKTSTATPPATTCRRTKPSPAWKTRSSKPPASRSKRTAADISITQGRPREVYRIPPNRPPTSNPSQRKPTNSRASANNSLRNLEQDLTTPGVTRARAAYIAICLGEPKTFKRESPADWSAAIAELQKHPAVVHDMFKSPEPLGDQLRHNAELAGLHEPKNLKLTERPLED